jgi:hypothetical protein
MGRLALAVVLVAAVVIVQIVQRAGVVVFTKERLGRRDSRQCHLRRQRYARLAEQPHHPGTPGDVEVIVESVLVKCLLVEWIGTA